MNHFRNRRVSITVLLGFIVLSGLALLAFATDYDATSGDAAEWASNTVDGNRFNDTGTTYNSNPIYSDGFFDIFKSTVSPNNWWVTDGGAVTDADTAIFNNDDPSDTCHWKGGTGTVNGATFTASTLGGSTATGTFTLAVAPTPTPTPTPAPEKPQVI